MERLLQEIAAGICYIDLIRLGNISLGMESMDGGNSILNLLVKILYMGKSDIICIRCKPEVCKFPKNSMDLNYIHCHPYHVLEIYKPPVNKPIRYSILKIEGVYLSGLSTSGGAGRFLHLLVTPQYQHPVVALTINSLKALHANQFP